jgi:hypothetical protein
VERAVQKNAADDDWACTKGNSDCKLNPGEEKKFMADKVALPSLSLPKQRTHWSVYVVIAAGAMFLIMCVALYMMLKRQHEAEVAFAKRQEAHQAELKAKVEADHAAVERAAAEKAAAEAKRKADEAAAAAAKKLATASADTGQPTKRRAPKRSSSTKTVAKGSTSSALPGAPAAPPPPPPKPKSKASQDIDELLKGFK